MSADSLALTGSDVPVVQHPHLASPFGLRRRSTSGGSPAAALRAAASTREPCAHSLDTVPEISGGLSLGLV